MEIPDLVPSPTPAPLAFLAFLLLMVPYLSNYIASVSMPATTLCFDIMFNIILVGFDSFMSK